MIKEISSFESYLYFLPLTEKVGIGRLYPAFPDIFWKKFTIWKAARWSRPEVH